MRNLKMLRIQAGKKQSEMAELLNIERSTYSKMESGRIKPSADTLITLGDFFGVSTDCLLDLESDDMSDNEIWELREELRRKPDLNMLFSLTKDATKEDILKTVKILKALKGED